MLTQVRMRLVSKDKEPLDLSQEKYKDVFMKSMENWSEAMANNKDGSKFGYIDIVGLDLQDFGTPYAA